MKLISEDLPALTYTDDVDLHVKLVRMRSFLLLLLLTEVG